MSVHDTAVGHKVRDKFPAEWWAERRCANCGEPIYVCAKQATAPKAYCWTCFYCEPS